MQTALSITDDDGTFAGHLTVATMYVGLHIIKTNSPFSDSKGHADQNMRLDFDPRRAAFFNCFRHYRMRYRIWPYGGGDEARRIFPETCRGRRRTSPHKVFLVWEVSTDASTQTPT